MHMNWDLSKLYTDFTDPAFEADLRTLEEEIAGANALLKAIAPGADEAKQLRELILLLQRMTDRSGQLQAMVQMTLAADSGCEAALGPRTRLLELGNEISLLESALTRWVGENPRMEALCAEDVLLQEHRLYFRKLKESARHLIDPALEPAVLRMQLSGGASWCRLRDELFSGLSIDLTIDGETRRLPLPAVRLMDSDARSEVREAAYRAELAAYPRIETAMAACLNGVEGEALTLCALQRYDSVLDWSLDLSRMDRPTLDALLGAMRESLPMFRRYFRLKARLLGRERLRFCDLFAPLGGNRKRYTLEEARDLLIQVFSETHPPIAAVMRRAFEENWIDAYPREGKEGGAFCEGVHALKMSYVLTNFDGSYSDVSTLAHELGHAYHDSRLNDASPLLCDIPMPLAETASTFNELLLSERMLEGADAQEALGLLDQQLGDAAQVIVDILSRFLFESEVVERRKEKTLSARELCEIMRDAQLETYGDGLDPDWLHPYMWACKPHYYDTLYHFYNYPYAFGLLFAAGLYARWQEMGDAFWPMYDRLLRFSGAGSVREAAASAGIDVSQPEFWRGALQFFARKLDLLEKRAFPGQQTEEVSNNLRDRNDI